nr:porin family protein [uncultured Flavobacterium sp.]
MITKLFFATISGLFFINVNAQHNPRNPVVTGVKGGLNLSNISAGNYSQNIKPSFHLGAVVEFPLSYYKKTALQVEMLYSNQGYNGKEIEKKIDGAAEIIETNTLSDVTLHYLNVPVLFKYYVKDQFSIEIGPQIGFLMGAKGTYDLYEFNEAREFIIDHGSILEEELYKYGYRDNNYKNFYDTLDYGLAVGISYNFDNGFFISGRYYLGLKDIYKADNDYSKIPIFEEMPDYIIDEINKINKNLDFKDVKNSVIQVSVGYRF